MRPVEESKLFLRGVEGKEGEKNNALSEKNAFPPPLKRCLLFS